MINVQGAFVERRGAALDSKLTMASKSLVPGTVLAGKYRIVALLGHGGMGSVYEAINDNVGRRVALKVIDQSLLGNPEFLKRFELEAKAAALISHPGLVDVYDRGHTDAGAPFIVMELLQGLTLSAMLRAAGRFSPDQAVSAMRPVLDALAAAHDRDVVHRDLKPGNIFVAMKPLPAVKVLDFGVSKFSSIGSTHMTLVGSMLGTPMFMAPEQMRDGSAVGPRSDLYSVGAMLYALLAGKPPFEAASDQLLEVQVLTQPHRPLTQERPEVPAALSTLIDKLLEKSPERRPRSARALHEALTRIVPASLSAIFELAQHCSSSTRTSPNFAPVEVPRASVITEVEAPPPSASTRLDAPRRRAAQTTQIIGAVVWRQRRWVGLALVALVAASFAITWMLAAPKREKKAPAVSAPVVLQHVAATPEGAQQQPAPAPRAPAERAAEAEVVGTPSEVSAKDTPAAESPQRKGLEGVRDAAPPKRADPRAKPAPPKGKESLLDTSNPYL